MKKLCIVSYSWYEEYEPVLLYGPESIDAERFEQLCKTLLHAAIEASCRTEQENWVGWDSIKKELVKLLTEKFGFEIADPPEFKLWGPNIIEDSKDGKGLPPETFELVFQHNRKIRDLIYRRSEPSQ